MSDLDRTLEVVTRREEEPEPDSIFALARGVAAIAFVTGYVTMCAQRSAPEHPVLGVMAFLVAAGAGWITTKAPPRRIRLRTRATALR